MSDSVRSELFEARIYTQGNALDAIEPFLESMLALPPELRPTHFRYGDRRKRAPVPEKVREAIAAKPPSTLYMGNESTTYATVVGFKQPSLLHNIDLHTPAATARPMVEALYQICRAYPPRTGWAHPVGDIAWNEGLNKHRSEDEPVVDRAAWIQILGTAQVEAIGAARVAKTPAFRVEMLAAGGAVIQATEDLLDVQSPAAREALVGVLVHLNPALDGAALLAELQARPAKIAEQRARAAATKLVLAPAESVPLAEAPPSDLAGDDASAALRKLSAEAEAYTAGFHAQIAQLTSQRSGALAKIDQHFLERDYWKQHSAAQIATQLAAPLGAYLGEVMVKELGGRWVPMRDRSRSYVVIGDRAWFPFARVQRYLQSQQATREQSLAYYVSTIKAAT